MNFKRTHKVTVIRMSKSFSSIEEALKAIKRGEFVVVLDNEDRENEGDLIMAAEFATEASLAFMIRYTSGVICVPALQNRLKDLELPLMVFNNSESRQCKFTISVDLIEGNTTGISASDRARTIRAIADKKISANEFNRPGHIFPLLALDGGVIARAGHTEAAVDLARLAGCNPVGYICELNNDAGKMMRRHELELFAQNHALLLITISDLIRYRFTHEDVIAIDNNKPPAILNTPNAQFEIQAFISLVDCSSYDVLIYGTVNNKRNVPVYIVKQGVEGSINAQWAQKQILLNKSGVVIYPSIILGLEKISGKKMAEITLFGMSMQIARKLQVKSVQLLSESTIEFDVSSFGIEVNVRDL